MTRGRDWSVLRTRDPVPGDPEELARLAREYQMTAQSLRDGAAVLRDVGCRSSTWDSPAGTAFGARMVDAVRALELARPRFERAAEVVSRYAGELVRAQAEADGALVSAWRAREDRDAADRVRRLVDDPLQERVWAVRAEEAQRRLDAADRRLAAAETVWWQAGARAAGALEAATAADGLADGWDVLGTVAVVAQAAGVVSTALGAGALFCLLVPGLQPLGAALGGLSVLTGLISAAAHYELYAHDRIDGSTFATEAALALTGIVGGALATGLRGAERFGGVALPGRLRTAGSAAVDGASTGAGPAWAARPGSGGPADADGRVAGSSRPSACLPSPDADRRRRRRGVTSTA